MNNTISTISGTLYLVMMCTLSACSGDSPADLGMSPHEATEFHCVEDEGEKKATVVTSGFKSFKTPNDMTLPHESLIKYFGWNASDTFRVATGDSYKLIVDDEGRPIYIGDLCFGNLQITGVIHIRKKAFKFNKDTVFTYMP